MDSRGVTPLIGFILILLLVMIGLGIVQSTFPDKYKHVEAQHQRELQSQLFDLKNTPSSVRSYKFDMGINYPQSLFFLSPSPNPTSMSFEEFNIKLDYTELLSNGSEVERTKNLTSTRVTITPNYMYYPQESLVMENTAIFKNVSGDRFIELSDQIQFTNSVKIEILNATYKSPSRSFSTTDSISVIKNPLSRGGNVLAKNLSISFESVYPDYWKDIEGYDVSVTDNEVNMEKNGSVILSLYRSSIGTSGSDNTSYTSGHTRIIKKYDHILKFESGETDVLNLIEVLDGYNNPVSSYRVEGTSSIGSLRAGTEFTDTYGEAHFTYDAPAVEDCRIGNITFTCPSCTGQNSVNYGIIITKADGTCSQSLVGDEALVYAGSTSVKPPNTINIPSTEVSDKAFLSKDENVYLETSASADGQYAAHRFNFSVGSFVDKINVRWNGKGGSHDYNGVTLYIWDYDQNKYEILDTEYHSSGETWLESVVDSHASKYIDRGYMTLLVAQNGDKDSKLYSDYLVVNTE
ncbi:MAG: hypothetical protein R6U44_06145 [Archaeoglobaceae archaeon]